MYLPGLNVKETAPYGLAILRIVLGIALAIHGWAKFSMGVGGLEGFFGSVGIPAPGIMAYVVSIVELVGGILLILGLGTQIVGILVVLDMLGAILFVRIKGGVISPETGALIWELEALIAAAALCLVLAGPGAWSVDDVVTENRSRA